MGDDGIRVGRRPPEQAFPNAIRAIELRAGFRALLDVALRAEQAKTGASANELAERVRGAMSRPLALR
ncbi:hypothetical protein ACWDRB_45730 [Nonomuraea sp. NPDC003707]